MKVLITGGLGQIARGGVVQVLENHFELRLTHYREPEKRCRYEFIKADIRDYEEVRRAVKGVDAIVHLAAKGAKNVLGTNPLLIYSTNVMGTANLLEAALEEGVKRFVYASSLWIYGLPLEGIVPEYFPLDEKHPLRPKSAYGLSKLLAEDLGKGYVRKGDFSFISLRIGGVRHREWPYGSPDINDLEGYAKDLCQHIDARDVGQLIKLSLQSNIRGFEAFNAVAEDHIFPEISSLELIKRFFPGVKEINNKDEFLAHPERSLVAIEKAKKMLGYSPAYNFRSYQQWLKEGKKAEDYYELRDIWRER